jgi:hypothetical protein
MSEENDIKVLSDKNRVKDFICHLIDEMEIVDGKIIEHYANSETMPDEHYEHARLAYETIKKTKHLVKAEIMAMEMDALILVRLHDVVIEHGRGASLYGLINIMNKCKAKSKAD